MICTRSRSTCTRRSKSCATASTTAQSALTTTWTAIPAKSLNIHFYRFVKEALSNIIRHSDADFVTVTLREHPALYQLIIKDNGSKKAQSGEGLGLKNITERVGSIGGLANIGYNNGFTVFVSIPKSSEALNLESGRSG